MKAFVCENWETEIQDSIGNVFKHILENAGVYKNDENGQQAFRLFCQSL